MERGDDFDDERDDDSLDDERDDDSLDDERDDDILDDERDDDLDDGVNESGPAIDSVPSRRPTGLVAGAVALALLAGLAGAIWTSTRSQNHESRARVSFTDWVEPGATDAERARIVALVPELTPEPNSVDGIEVWVELPDGRNFIDVYARGKADAVRAAADAAAQRLVEAEQLDQTGRIDEAIAIANAGFDDIQGDIDALAEEMEVLLEQEAEAEGRRADAPNGAAVEQAVIDARTASEEYWELARRRNALIDEQTRFEREIARYENDRLIPSDLEVTTPATVGEPVSDISALTGFIGGLAAAAGLLLLLWAMASPAASTSEP